MKLLEQIKVQHCWVFMRSQAVIKLADFGKLTCWKVFTAANENIINAFQRLTDNEDHTVDSIRDRLVQFVIKFYCKQVPKKGLTLAEARWYLFSK